MVMDLAAAAQGIAFGSQYGVFAMLGIWPSIGLFYFPLRSLLIVLSLDYFASSFLAALRVLRSQSGKTARSGER